MSHEAQSSASRHIRSTGETGRLQNTQFCHDEAWPRRLAIENSRAVGMNGSFIGKGVAVYLNADLPMLHRPRQATLQPILVES